MQYIKYATSLYYANCLEKTEEAISIALEALSINEPFSIDCVNPNRTFTNIEMSLLNTIAVDYCRLEQMDEAKELYTLAHSLGNYLYDPTYQKEHNKEYLLGEYYTCFSTC